MAQTTPQTAQPRHVPAASPDSRMPITAAAAKQPGTVRPQFAGKTVSMPVQAAKPAVSPAVRAATPPKKKMPLYVPRAQNWEEEPLPINSNNIYQLLASPVNKTLDELVKDPGMPILAFTGTLLQEIRYITNKLSNSEYAVFLVLRRIDGNHPHFLAYDFFMPEQKASGGGVSLDPGDCQRHFNGLKTHPWYHENGLHRHLCHLHSHAGMGVFWSSTDDTQQLSRDDLGFMDDYRFYCVVNSREEIKCSFVFYKPVLARVDAAVAVSFSGQDHAEQLTRKRRRELDDMIDAVVSGYSPSARHASEFGGTAVGQTPGSAMDNAKGDSFYYGSAGEKLGVFRGGWGNKSYSDWFARRNAGNASRDDYDEYWDSFHGRNAGCARGGNEWRDDAVWDSKNWADPSNQPTDLGWFASFDDYKRRAKISDAMLQAFMNSANVERKYARRARNLLSWVMEHAPGPETFMDGKDAGNNKPETTQEQEAIIGEIIGEYVGELVCALRENKASPEYWEDKLHLSEDACQAIRSGNRDKINEAVISDLSEFIADLAYDLFE